MINFKKFKLENNEKFKKGIEIGKLYAEQLSNDDPEKYEKIKKTLKKIMKGEKNVDL